MIGFSRHAVAAVTTVTLGLGLLGSPAAASTAAGGTDLSAAQMVAAIRAAASKSASAMTAGGWSADLVSTDETGKVTGAESYVYDRTRGQASTRQDLYGKKYAWYGLDRKGEYEPVTPDDAPTLAMMGRPGVTHVYNPYSGFRLDMAVSLTFPDPSFLVELEADTAAAGTRTTRADGGADYAYTGREGVATVIHVNPDATVGAAEFTADGDRETYAFTYGQQKVALPPAPVTVTSAELQSGYVYEHIDASVRIAAVHAGKSTVKAAKGKSVQISALRKITAKAAASWNRDLGPSVLKVTHVPRGARLYATNPWTKQTFAYRITASGKKAVVTKE